LITCDSNTNEVKSKFVTGNVFELSFPEVFDAVLITEVIEHVAHPDAFLKKVSALVRLGGCIVLTTPNGRYFRNRFAEVFRLR